VLNVLELSACIDTAWRGWERRWECLWWSVVNKRGAKDVRQEEAAFIWREGAIVLGKQGDQGLRLGKSPEALGQAAARTSGQLWAAG
jgi:hypothetical protein